MSLLNKLFSVRGGSALGGKKTEKEKSAKVKKPQVKIKETVKPAVAVDVKKTEAPKKSIGFSAKGGSAIGGKPIGILLSSLATEKAMSGQSFGKYVFKVDSSANKIEIAKTIGKNYNVKVIAVNIVNIPKKARRVGKTPGFKSGYKKAVVTLEKGQSIE